MSRIFPQGEELVSEGHTARPRTAILVLGMGRSGTSASTRVLNLLGADLPRDLMQAGKGNEIGHWEPNSVVSLNDELLSSGGSKWNDWLPFNDSWNRSAVYRDFFTRAQDVVRADYGTSPLFVLKDPRICKLAPFWLNVIESLGIQPVIALPQRNPIEVSASLSSRDGSQVGHGLLLWLRHVLDAEAATRGRARHFFSYDQLLTNWPQTIERFEASTGITMPRRSVCASEEIAQFLTRDAQHQHAEHRLLTSAPTWVHDTYAIMQNWCETGENPDDFEQLDEIRSAFDVMGPAFVQFAIKGLDSSDQARSTNQDQLELERMRNDLLEKQEEAFQAWDTVAEQRDAIEQLQRQCEERQAERDQLVKQAEMAEDANEWLRAISLLREQSPSWWSLLPLATRQKLEARNAQRRGLFDGDAYLARYPDVSDFKMGPLAHYMRHGMREGRTR